MLRRDLIGAGAAALAAACLPAGAAARTTALPGVDRVIVVKSRRRLMLMRRGSVLASFNASLGRAPTGHKLREGDGRTPEGRYVIDRRNPNSRFHLSIGVSYPNEDDRARAALLGVDPGGDIMIHGLSPDVQDLGPRHHRFDWTEGCIAVTNKEMDLIWGSVALGTPVEILP